MYYDVSKYMILRGFMYYNYYILLCEIIIIGQAKSCDPQYK